MEMEMEMQLKKNIYKSIKTLIRSVEKYNNRLIEEVNENNTIFESYGYIESFEAYETYENLLSSIYEDEFFMNKLLLFFVDHSKNDANIEVLNIYANVIPKLDEKFNKNYFSKLEDLFRKEKIAF